MTSSTFQVHVDGDANVESSLRSWAAARFVESNVERDPDGRVVLVCKHSEAKSAKSFKLMMRNFEQRGGQVGKVLCLLCEPTNDAAGGGSATTDVAPTADFAHPRPDAMANAEIVFFSCRQISIGWHERNTKSCLRFVRVNIK